MTQSDRDRISRAWLALLTLYLVFQGPLMNQKLGMACGSAMEALKGLRQSRAEIDALRLQIQTARTESRREINSRFLALTNPSPISQ